MSEKEDSFRLRIPNSWLSVIITVIGTGGVNLTASMVNKQTQSDQMNVLMQSQIDMKKKVDDIDKAMAVQASKDVQDSILMKDVSSIVKEHSSILKDYDTRLKSYDQMFKDQEAKWKLWETRGK